MHRHAAYDREHRAGRATAPALTRPQQQYHGERRRVAVITLSRLLACHLLMATSLGPHPRSTLLQNKLQQRNLRRLPQNSPKWCPGCYTLHAPRGSTVDYNSRLQQWTPTVDSTWTNEQARLGFSCGVPALKPELWRHGRDRSEHSDVVYLPPTPLHPPPPPPLSPGSPRHPERHSALPVPQRCRRPFVARALPSGNPRPALQATAPASYDPSNLLFESSLRFFSKRSEDQSSSCHSTSSSASCSPRTPNGVIPKAVCRTAAALPLSRMPSRRSRQCKRKAKSKCLAFSLCRRGPGSASLAATSSPHIFRAASTRAASRALTLAAAAACASCRCGVTPGTHSQHTPVGRTMLWFGGAGKRREERRRYYGAVRREQ